MRHAVILIWLILVWSTLWEAASWANLISGLIVAVAVVYMLPPKRADGGVGFRPIAAVRLLTYFLWELIRASALLAWEVVTPRMRVRAAVISVQLTSRFAGIITAVANMVSLTPGTVTLEFDGENGTLFIHVLHLFDLDQTRESVLRLESLTLAAFPPRNPHPLSTSGEGDPR